MTLLDIQPVSGEFLARLREDLDEAEFCRFAVAYISSQGLANIGEERLARVLGRDHSFGVGSLTCACGYMPLVALQRRVRSGGATRLKYFMDPGVERRTDDEDDIRLLHTKVIYLAQPTRRKAVIYVGSHNWSERALGPGAPRNAEASLRLEEEFSDEHLRGTGDTLGSAVNAHLMSCYNLPLCLAADDSNLDKFQEWQLNVCGGTRGEQLKEIAVVLAVRRDAAAGGRPVDLWTGLEGRSIYMQVFDEDDGTLVLNHSRNVLVMLWDSESDLVSAEPPTILVCHVSASNAGPRSSLAGRNRSDNPIAGFAAVILDRQQLESGREGGRGGRRLPLNLPSGLAVYTYDFEHPAPSADSRTIDAGTRPTYQFNLEVEHVVVPGDRLGDAGIPQPPLVWMPGSFAVAAKATVPVKKSPGFRVDARTEQEMLQCMREIFQVDPAVAKVRPYSQADDPSIGLRVADYPLNDLLTGREPLSPEEFYDQRRRERSPIVPSRIERVGPWRRGSSVQRAERVFTRKLKRLLAVWGH